MFKIETKRLFLRDMILNDVKSFVAISQERDYQEYYSEQDCQPELYEKLTRQFADQANQLPRQAYQLAVECRATSQMIGVVCLRLESEDQASFGCGLATNRWGEGLMREAARALLNYGFEHLKIHRIYAETISENCSAIKLCHSLKMRKEAHFAQHRFFKQRWWDTAVYAILRNEWLELNSKEEV